MRFGRQRDGLAKPPKMKGAVHNSLTGEGLAGPRTADEFAQ